MKKQQDFSEVTGSVTAARGFRAAGIVAGIKPERKPDLALIVSDVPATAAAVFTTNKVKAAPVRVSMSNIKSGRICAIVANSGNANACTGPVGLTHARAMCAAVARRINCEDEHVLVCSTGRIGVHMPIVKIEAGIKKALGQLSRQGGAQAARAIMTSDTRPKEVAVRFKVAGKTVHIGGIAKGAGMIHPNMATMLSFITTDAELSRADLQKALRDAVGVTFNRISVDGDTSTNDTVLLLANGAAGTGRLRGELLRTFRAALTQVCATLAKKIVLDGECATRFITLEVTGAQSDQDAERAARAVCNSMLTKSSWFGGDPNWGRIMCAVGYSGAEVDDGRVGIRYDGVEAVRDGMVVSANLPAVKKVAARSAFTITVTLGLGRGRCIMQTTDLSPEYVDFNKGE
jgi:glutamate N-acetyltransferase/amino-acid N-acetyltransferase